MNKENKKMAQQRRAAEREKKEKQAKMKKGAILLAVVLIVGVLVFITVKEVKAPAPDTTTGDAAQTETVDGSSEGISVNTEATPALNTDEGLVVEEGDTVNIDYTGYKDGEAFDGGSTNGAGTDLTIGSDMYIDGFEDGLIGHKVGETVDLNLTFPENYGATDLAGADVVFTVTINGIYK